MKLIIDIPEYNLNDIQNGSIACSQVLKAVKNGKAYEERPQGEWIYDSSIPNWVCSICGAVPSDWGGKTNDKYTVTKINRFCRSCGADMQEHYNAQD